MNLPNALTVGRIAITPLIAVLPFAPATTPRLIAFILFLFAAGSDYADGVLARSRKQETTLGKLLDPLADKLLLVGTFIPMWDLMQSGNSVFSGSSFGTNDLSLRSLPFLTPWGEVGLPWWIIVIVLGRELITSGDELLLGFTIDTNAAHLARELASIGIGIRRRATVGDVAVDIVSVVREAIDRTGAVITTGGLGPTSDDLTKPAIASLFGRGMQLDEAHLAWMEQRWQQRFHRRMPESNRAQAMLPEGATHLVNQHGSAPGIWLEDERKRWVAMLPGVPREMRGMLADTLLPILRTRVAASGAATVVRSRTLRTTGVAESQLADQIDPIRDRLGPIALAYLPAPDGADLRLTIRGVSAAEADAVPETAAHLLREHIGRPIYAAADTDLAPVVLDRCPALALTIAVAESCTGGLLGARLTAIPGSSDVVLGGVIAYAHSVKEELLDGSEAALVKY